MRRKVLSREEFQKIYDQGPDACYELFQQLFHQVEILTKRVQILEEQLSSNSKNTHKPPSTDKKITRKTNSLRKKSKKKPGGQKGHKGDTLHFSSSPDFVEEHSHHDCPHCNNSLDNAEVVDVEKRQVFDLPPQKLEITEHQSPLKKCVHCQKVSKAPFPEGVTAKTQYGNRLKALCVYLHSYQFLPFKRISEFFKELFSHPISTGTLVNMEKTASENLGFFEEMLKLGLLSSKNVHFDESGIRYEGRRKWFHVASTPELTYYYAHDKRGEEGMRAAGVLPEFAGNAVHDFWKSYLKFENCEHSLCNVHHLRDLTFLEEKRSEKWATEMKSFLLKTKKRVEKAVARGPTISNYLKKDIENRYKKIVKMGLKETEEPEKRKAGQRGKIGKSKGRNLVERFLNYQEEILRFVSDFEVPFSNNQAERDVRMVKVQQKISGSFRAKSGAERFCRIRSYLSTAKKHHLNILEALEDAFLFNPFIPTF